MVANIYRRFKTCAGGADGGVVGLNGSIRATCLFHLLRALDICGREVLDFGAGDGRVLLAAMAVGASKASGYELPENKAHRFVFDAVRKTLADSETDASPSASRVAWSRADWLARDINVLRELPGRPSSVFTFWVGMPLPTQEHILALCARSPSIDAIAVFRDNKWRKPEEGVCSSHCSPCTQSHAALNLPFKLITFPSSPSPIALSFVVSKTTVSNIENYSIEYSSSNRSLTGLPPTSLFRPIPPHPHPTCPPVTEVLDALSSCRGAACAARRMCWSLVERVSADMCGSGERHEAWVFRKASLPPPSQPCRTPLYSALPGSGPRA